MARFFLALLLLLPLATPVRAAESAVETQLRYLEKDLDRLREEVKALPEAHRLERLEAEIAGLREAIKAAEKSAKEAVKDEIKDQDTRIADLSLLLADGANKISVSSYLATWASVLITLSLFVITAFMALRVPQQAKEAAREKAEEITEKSVIAAKDQATYIATKISTDKSERVLRELQESFNQRIDMFFSEKIEPIINDIQSKAENQRNEINRLNSIEIERIRSTTKITSINEESKIIQLREKYNVESILSIPEKNRTINNWHSLLSYFYEINDFAEMERHSENALKNIENDDTSKALILNLQATSKEGLNKFDAAISIYNKIINEYKNETSENIVDEVSKSYINKGVAFSKKYSFDKIKNQDSAQHAVESFDEAINFCARHNNLRLKHAIALFYKGSAQEEDLWDDNAAKDTFNKYLLIFSESDDSEIRVITKKVRQRLLWLDPSANSA